MSMNTSFWRDYQGILVKQKVALKVREWYLRWAKAFEKALPNKPLNERTIEDVQTYIDIWLNETNIRIGNCSKQIMRYAFFMENVFRFPWAKPWPVVVKNKKI